jgi:hypothetical protein
MLENHEIESRILAVGPWEMIWLKSCSDLPNASKLITPDGFVYEEHA